MLIWRNYFYGCYQTCAHPRPQVIWGELYIVGSKRECFNSWLWFKVNMSFIICSVESYDIPVRLVSVARHDCTLWECRRQDCGQQRHRGGIAYQPGTALPTLPALMRSNVAQHQHKHKNKQILGWSCKKKHQRWQWTGLSFAVLPWPRLSVLLAEWQSESAESFQSKVFLFAYPHFCHITLAAE